MPSWPLMSSADMISNSMYHGEDVDAERAVILDEISHACRLTPTEQAAEAVARSNLRHVRTQSHVIGSPSSVRRLAGPSIVAALEQVLPPQLPGRRSAPAKSNMIDWCSDSASSIVQPAASTSAA
jgi:hypothetical protein